MRHTTAHRGKRLHVIMKSGERFVDKLVDLTDRHFVFESRGTVLKTDVRTAPFARADVIRMRPKR